MFDRAFATLSRPLGWPLTALLASLVSIGPAGAVEITAEYRASEHTNEFRNTTPNSGHCAEFGCENGLFSVGIPVNYDRTVKSGLPAVPERWSIQTPRETTVNVVSDEGARAALQFQITHVAQALTEGVAPLPKLANPAAHYSAGGGCTWVAGQIYEGSGKDAGFVWKVNNPQSPSACYPTSSYVDDQETITPRARSFSVGYRLILPRPHTMPMGTYRGSVTFSVGETGDFALGSQVSGLSTGSVTFNFTLTVHHEVQVQFPANSDRAILEPPETWQKYLTTGVAPRMLRANLPFLLTASGPMSIKMQCDVQWVNGCYIRNHRTGESSTFIVMLHPPKGLEDSFKPGTQAPPRALNNDQAYTFITSRVLSSEPGKFSFEMHGGHIDKMLAGAGDEWTGMVTLVFDATL